MSDFTGADYYVHQNFDVFRLIAVTYNISISVIDQIDRTTRQCYLFDGTILDIPDLIFLGTFREYFAQPKTIDLEVTPEQHNP